MTVYYDVHIHSCLSPCGDDDMTPNNIAGMAHLNGLNLIALSDHNSCKNCESLMKAVQAYDGLIALPGMELTTQEEVHILCLFPALSAAMEFDQYVGSRLIQVENRPDIFGRQLVLNERDEPVGEEPFLLINATEISVSDAPGIVERHGGIAIPAHIDKMANSMISQLGFLPPDPFFGCFEVANPANLPNLLEENPILCDKLIITDSDAHYLEHIHEQEYSFDLPELSADAFFHFLREGICA